MEQEHTTLLSNYSMEERGAYLAALASVASVDGHASPEELEFLTLLAQAAEMPDNVQQEVLDIAKNPSQISMQRVLDTLKKSQLRFSFVTDIISFAKADGEYSPEEQRHIQQLAAQLGVDQQQYSLLEQFVSKADEAQQHGEDPTSNAFISKSGFSDMFQKAGISPQMVQGMLGIAAPLILARMMGGRRGGMMGGLGGVAGGGLLASVLGGMMSGKGGMMGGGRRANSGLGSMASVLGGLNGRKGYGGGSAGGGLGGLLGGLLGGGTKRGGGTAW